MRDPSLVNRAKGRERKKEKERGSERKGKRSTCVKKKTTTPKTCWLALVEVGSLCRVCVCVNGPKWMSVCVCLFAVRFRRGGSCPDMPTGQNGDLIYRCELNLPVGRFLHLR